MFTGTYSQDSVYSNTGQVYSVDMSVVFQLAEGFVFKLAFHSEVSHLRVGPYPRMLKLYSLPWACQLQ